MLEKDKSIHELLARLPLDERVWVIKDHWDADLMAVGCEVPTGPEPTDFRTSERGEDVDYGALLAAMERHLAHESA